MPLDIFSTFLSWQQQPMVLNFFPTFFHGNKNQWNVLDIFMGIFDTVSDTFATGCVAQQVLKAFPRGHKRLTYTNVDPR
jgi:hypothetical protein